MPRNSFGHMFKKEANSLALHRNMSLYIERTFGTIDASRCAAELPAGGGMSGVRKVLVYGVTGSGKTTMAEAISKATSLPWHSVDDLTWQPGWVEVPG